MCRSPIPYDAVSGAVHAAVPLQESGDGAMSAVVAAGRSRCGRRVRDHAARAHGAREPRHRRLGSHARLLPPGFARAPVLVLGLGPGLRQGVDRHGQAWRAREASPRTRSRAAERRPRAGHVLGNHRHSDDDCGRGAPCSPVTRDFCIAPNGAMATGGCSASTRSTCATSSRRRFPAQTLAVTRRIGCTLPQILPIAVVRAH